MLRPTILFTVIVSTIGATQLFGEPLLFGGAGGYRGGADTSTRRSGSTCTNRAGSTSSSVERRRSPWTMFLIIMLAVAVNALLARCAAEARVVIAPQAEAGAQPSPRRHGGGPGGIGRRAARRPLTYVVLIVVTILAIVPLYWTVVGRIRTNAASRRRRHRSRPAGTSSRTSATRSTRST